MKLGKTFFLCLMTSQLFGTAQIPDILIHKGDTMMLHSVPLESYKIENFSNPKKLFNGSGCLYTACYRNYIATWEIIENQIYLVELKNACYPTELRGAGGSFKSIDKIDSLGVQFAELNKLFPKNYKNGKVKADWVNSELICPRGKLIEYIHSGFDSIYEQEIGYKFKNGILTDIEKYDNSNSRKSIYSTNSDSLHNFLFRNLNWEWIEKHNTNNDKITIVNFEVDDNAKLVNLEIIYRKINDQIDNEVIRVVGLIPEWDIKFKKGKSIRMRWNLPVKLDKQFYLNKINNNCD